MKTRLTANARSVTWTALMLLAGGHAALASDDAPRVTVTTQGLTAELAGSDVVLASRDEFDALVTDGDRGKTSADAGQQKASRNNLSAVNIDFWFYDVYTELFADSDRDGYYSGIVLTFDADTIWTAADVFAVVYLSYEYGPWNEYAETDVFTIFGASALDEYTIETDLVAGYPPGEYDVLIELYDAYDGALVASIGPEDSPYLALLPLEDAGFDSPGNDVTQIVVNSGGGGSVGASLLALLAAAAWRLRRRGIRASRPLRHFAARRAQCG